MQQEDVIREYRKHESIKETARRLGISEGVVRKCLVGCGIVDTPATRKISALLRDGMSQKEIAELLGVSVACVNVNTPYERSMYIEPSRTVNAQRIRKCREKKVSTTQKKSE